MSGGPGPWAWYVAIWRWRARRKGEALAGNFLLAVTTTHLVAVKTDYWMGKRVKGAIGVWDRDDLVVGPAGLEGEGGRNAWAMRVQNKRSRRSFEAKPLLLTDQADEVFRLLRGAETTST
jgi:hypothetical protein